MKKIIIDSSTYSNFVRTGTFWILKKLFKNRLAMTYLVKEEIKKGFENYLELRSLNDHIKEGSLEIISDLSEQELVLITNLPRCLSSADKSCISVAKERKATIASDDEDIIREAKNFNINLIDTIEIVIIAVQKRLFECNKGNEILEKMEKEANFLTINRLDCNKMEN
ncbi:MAG: hypothetical protein AB1410_03680 [Acidobacteriota bacterium]